MAKMKKVLAIAMAAAMGMSMLAGCGGQGKDDVTEATSQAETSEAATSEEKTEEAASEEAEQEKTEVKAGDVLIDLNFDDNDTDECHTYSNGGQAVLGAENGELEAWIMRTRYTMTDLSSTRTVCMSCHLTCTAPLREEFSIDFR